MQEKKSFVTEIIIAVIVNLCASAILAICSVIWNQFNWDFIWLSIIFAIIIVIQLIALVCYIVWNKKSYKSYYYPCKKIDYKYIIEEMTINYTLNTKKFESGFIDELNLSREIAICSDCNALDRINDKYIWTGKSEAKLPHGKANVRSIQKLEDKPGIWKYFEVVFDRRLQKGEKINLSYQWPTIKMCKTSSPFISTLTDVPTKKIIFNINLGSDYAGKKIHIEERRSIDGDNMLDCCEYQLDEKGCKKIPVYPHRFRYFIVFWKW